jgi:hypothetical protein
MFRSLPLIAVFACAPVEPEAPFSAGPWPEPSAYVPQGEVQALVGPLVLVGSGVYPGGVLDLSAGNADPGETVYFAASVGGVAAGPCLAFLGGLCLDLGAQTVYAGFGVADAQGVATLQLPVDSTLVQGARYTFQAAVRRGAGGGSSEKSNALVRTVGAPSWSNPVTVDGSLAEWSGDELFTTTSANNSQGGVTWDAASLFVAFDHPDVASGGAQHWEVVYLATGGPGSTEGPALGGQVPGLPFEADVVVRRKADGSYDDVCVWDEVQGWVITPGVLSLAGWGAAESGSTLELQLPRSALPFQLELATAQVYEGAGFESTYAGIPSTAFRDGFDPDLADSLVLDLSLPDPSGIQNP